MANKKNDMSNNGMQLTKSIRYGWLAAISSVVFLAVFIAAQFIATQHISQLGNLPAILALIAFLTILSIFISTMMLLAIESMYNEIKKMSW
jgi:flagellar biosynthesis protein FliQ